MYREKNIAHQYASLSSRGWTKDRRRCKRAGVPKAVKFRTRHELAMEMLEEHGELLPHAWVAGDDEMGRPTDFR